MVAKEHPVMFLFLLNGGSRTIIISLLCALLSFAFQKCSQICLGVCDAHKKFCAHDIVGEHCVNLWGIQNIYYGT